MKFIYATLFVFLFFSCELFREDEYHYLSDDFKSSYNEGDTLAFMNNHGQNDTLIVEKKINGFVFYSLTGSAYKAPYKYYEFEKIGISRLHDSILDFGCSSLLNVERTEFLEQFSYNCDKWIDIKIGLTDVCSRFDTIPIIKWYGDLMENDSYSEDTILNGQHFDDVFFYTLEDNEDNYFRVI